MMRTVSPGFAWFAAASLALGLTTISPQLIVPLAATLARPAERGKVVGAVMSGLLVGVLASRTFSGLVAQRLGWRAVYLIAACLSVALALALRLLLPRSEPHGQRLSYPRLLASVWSLLRDEPVLRQSCLFGAATFGAMSAFWNTVAFFLAGPPYEYGSDQVGLVGLVGVAGALAASASGRLADRLNPRLLIGSGMALMLLAKSEMPIGSTLTRFSFPGLGSCGSSNVVSANTIRPHGKIEKKISRHENSIVSKPPIALPATAAAKKPHIK